MAAVVSLSIVLLILSWGITLHRLDAEHTLVISNASKQQENLATIIAENLSQILDRGRLIALAANGFFDETPASQGQRLAFTRSVDPAILRISLYGPNAKRVIASSTIKDSTELTAAIQAMLAEKNLPLATNIHVLPPTSTLGQTWDIPILFPIVGNDDSLHGVLLTVLDVGYFLGLYHQIDFGKSGIIRLFNSDGVPLAEAHRAGMALIEDRAPRTLPKSSSNKPEATQIGLEAGRLVLSTHRRLSNFPLTIGISREIDEIQAEHNKTRSRILILLGGLSFLLIIAMCWIIANLQRHGRLLRKLERINEDNLLLIEQLEEEKDRASKLAAHDHLTGLHNRRMFQELAMSHISRAKRSHHQYALIFLDLDRFKSINDTLGHHVGDTLLQMVASRLRLCVRESDLVARLGGDEFSVLLTGLESIDDIEAIAIKLIEQISQPCIDLDGHDVNTTPSIGIAVFPRDGLEFETLCRNADSAMYQSKRNGRGRYTFYDSSLNRSSDRQFNLEQRLPKAIASGELILHFQPKVRLSDYRIVGFEALVRWQHPEQGLIFPNDFIPLAESSGAIIDLGQWVIENCCRQLAEWQKIGLDVVPIAFNVSARQLQDEQLPATVARCLEQFGIDGSLLEAEITESSLVESFELASTILLSLERQGLSIALDDFGNGFSNLGYIRSMPIRRLKIDQSFIADIHKHRENSAIVDSIISLAHKLNQKVVAEGVETPAQIMHLKTVNCDEIQGYLISRPVAADAAGQFLIHSKLTPT